MERQGFQTASSSQNTGPQSVSKQRNLGAPPDYMPGEDLRLLLTLVFFGRKIKAPTQLLHAPIGSALHGCQTNATACLTEQPGCLGRDSETRDRAAISLGYQRDSGKLGCPIYSPACNYSAQKKQVQLTFSVLHCFCNTSNSRKQLQRGVLRKKEG